MHCMRSWRSGLVLAALVVVILASAGCGRPVRIDVTSASTVSIYYQGDPQAAVNRHIGAGTEDNSFGLHMSMAGSAYLAMGDYDNAYRTLRSTYDMMNGFINDPNGTPHFYAPEANKSWIGDPIEMALNSWYIAVLNFRRADYGNCIAACKNAELADQPLKWDEQTEEQIKNNAVPTEKYVDDMGMIYLLQARAQLREGGWTKDEIANTVQLGKDAFIRTPLFDPASAQAKVEQLFTDATDPKKNVLFVVDLGLCPKHEWTGEHNEMVKIRPVQYQDTNAKLTINGSTVLTDRVCDVAYQKVHRGGREFDETLNGRAVFKDNAMEGGKVAVGVGAAMMMSDNATARGIGAGVALVGLLFMAASANTHPEADLRQWEALPGQINMVFVELKPGKYTVDCDALGLDMQPLMPPRQARQEFTVPAKGDMVVYLRPLPACGNPTQPLEVGPTGGSSDSDAARQGNDNGEAALAKETEKAKAQNNGNATETPNNGWGARTEPAQPQPAPQAPTNEAPKDGGWGTK